jgi:hypothetical protein
MSIKTGKLRRTVENEPVALAGAIRALDDVSTPTSWGV